MARPKKCENRVKTRCFEHFFKERACKNNGKTDAEPQPKYPQGSRPRAKKRAKTRWFCNGLRKSNKSELKRTQQNQKSVASPRKREKRTKTRGFEHLFKERACKNDEKTDAEPRPRGPKNAVKRDVFATFSKKQTRTHQNSRKSENREKHDKTHGSRRLFKARSPAEAEKNRENIGKTRCF